MAAVLQIVPAARKLITQDPGRDSVRGIWIDWVFVALCDCRAEPNLH